MADLQFGVFTGPAFERVDDRGVFAELFNEGLWESVACCEMHEGAVMGGHYHRHTVVLVYFLSGGARIRTVDVGTGAEGVAEVGVHQGFVFRPEEAREITYLEPSRILLLKSHRYDPADPDLVDHPMGRDSR